jgi:hypothetical protein
MSSDLQASVRLLVEDLYRFRVRTMEEQSWKVWKRVIEGNGRTRKHHYYPSADWNSDM